YSGRFNATGVNSASSSTYAATLVTMKVSSGNAGSCTTIVQIWNDVYLYNGTLTLDTLVQGVISGLTLKTLTPFVPVNGNATVNVSIVTGSPWSYQVTVNGSTTIDYNVTSPWLNGTGRVALFSMSFPSIGVYLPAVSAQNTVTGVLTPVAADKPIFV